MVDTEAAWQAVEAHFPDADSYYHDLARRGLADYYLFRGREPQYEKALEPLGKLADLGATNPPLEAYGIAGLVVVQTKLGNIEQARNENSRLSSEMRALVRESAPQLYDLLEQALRELEPPRG
jgi:hypothetical protein